ncbi:cupin domain-containing protein [Kaistia dalseonensis]|uniref:Transcriptional regulator with XRE-family HTH domain n=1 Tax=Kaistia dalseonensis TaxID=410840 RepID=A0ABU0HEJ9_9HYPH|nr:cupin domain-containing protein [Kaistia dalseonensis]MCX5497738.1 cupin domain-containing protein [Kaistia dalseonensis]MDQ0440382.1 transcriptional regulator with XRE-family HTH domain [Kaistia dalseonensis]
MNARNFDLDVGARLRELRVREGLSQRALAKRAGVSNATISMVEANRISPSVSGLRQILSGIPLSLSEFFAEAKGEADKVVFRAGELKEIAGGPISFRQVGTNLEGRSLQMMHERYQAGAVSGKAMLSHQGEEAGLVIRGRMLLEVDGSRYELSAGDAYFFDSRKPHAFKNIGEGELELVSACTPPTF